MDVDTARTRLVRKLTPPFESRLSGGGRALLVEHPGLEADLWVMELRK